LTRGKKYEKVEDRLARSINRYARLKDYITFRGQARGTTYGHEWHGINSYLASPSPPSLALCIPNSLSLLIPSHGITHKKPPPAPPILVQKNTAPIQIRETGTRVGASPAICFSSPHPFLFLSLPAFLYQCRKRLFCFLRRKEESADAQPQ